MNIVQLHSGRIIYTPCSTHSLTQADKSQSLLGRSSVLKPTCISANDYLTRILYRYMMDKLSFLLPTLLRQSYSQVDKSQSLVDQRA